MYHIRPSDDTSYVLLKYVFGDLAELMRVLNPGWLEEIDLLTHQPSYPDLIKPLEELLHVYGGGV